MSFHLFRRISSGKQDCKYRNLILIFLFVMFIGSIAFGIFSNFSKDIRVSEIVRNDYGKGNVKEAYKVYVDGEKLKDKIEIQAGERMYTPKELQKAMKRAVTTLEIEMLGENPSVDQVTKNLNLIHQIPGEPMEVRWEIDRHDVVDFCGILNQEVLREHPEGILVTFKAVITYTEGNNETVLHEMILRIFPPKLQKTERIIEDIKEAVKDNEKTTRTSKSFNLPNKVGEHDVVFKKPGDKRGIYLAILFVIVSVLLFCLKKQEEKKEQFMRKRQMTVDYPEIVHKISLLIGGGMSVKNAWNKIGEDYEKKRRETGKRYAYEEVLVTCHEMRSSVTESECYINFGRRCKGKEYRKLGALLAQNTKKGNKGLIELLSAEASYALEERRTEAKRQGEEAETKLLLPMFLMMAVVLIIVIIPAFLSINL